MKKISALFAISLLFAIFSANVFGQSNTATATATATIVTPISLSSNRDLSFGNILSATTAGSVEITPAGVRTATTVTLPAILGSISSAQFVISGTSGMTYTLTLPTSITINDGSSHTMTINGFQHNATGTLPGTSETFQVGATLQVGASQAAGVYGPGSFSVEVNYN